MNRMTESHNGSHNGEGLIAGKHPVLEALRSGREMNKIWMAEGAQKSVTAAILSEAKKHGVIVQYVDKRKLDQLVPGLTHQGVVAQAAAFDYVELEQLLEIPKQRDEMPFFIILDEIEDPHNLGSILRT